MKKEWFSSSPEDTSNIALEVAVMIENKEISPWVFLKGDIGSGKTTFIRALLSFWGITEGVSSPTFSLIHHYPHPQKNIYHVDLYRLRSPEEVDTIGLYDLFHPENLVFVEWPEVIEDSLCFPHTRIQLFYTEEENSRRILLTSEA
ncbi:MAG: tRNA (adenosine(37)-N6)-threonylcarbamoyltransferase complex ATPase subunit type 1 TsaE [Brevinematales bacterium]|nr:tRNA (adenosine(37)-N6)-threonylcarbamoyltransferase complex ATPase subunit type 1 TsaE [Brevinematales bacterium]